ncbi:MAG TPA: hypothetical protein VK549_17750 [Acidimicrobiia bacterium]|nr:hypothetical protein [Acidimicrobiia bacterium]
MSSTAVGLFAGLLLGLALIIGDFGDMLIVALFGAIGYLVARVVQGDLDLNDLMSQAQRKPRR